MCMAVTAVTIFLALTAALAASSISGWNTRNFVAAVPANRVRHAEHMPAAVLLFPAATGRQSRAPASH